MSGAVNRIAALILLRLRVSRSLLPAIAVQGLAIPSVFLFVLTHQVRGSTALRAAIGLATLSAFTLVLRRVAHANVSDVVTGRANLLRTTAVSRAELLFASVVDGAAVGLVALLFLLGATLLAGVGLPSTWYWLVAFVLGALAFASMGAIIGALTDNPGTVNLLTSTTTLLCGALCPLLYSLDKAPAVIRPVVAVLPPSLEALAMLQSWGSSDFPEERLAALLAWVAVLYASALLLTRRPRRR